MVLPLIIIAAGIYLTVTWKPERGRTLVGRIFLYTIAAQFVFGLIVWLYGISAGRGDYLGYPFILHPILGLLAIGLASFAVYQKPGSPLASLGRWAPLAAMGVLFVIVSASIVTGLQQ